MSQTQIPQATAAVIGEALVKINNADGNARLGSMGAMENLTELNQKVTQRQNTLGWIALGLSFAAAGLGLASGLGVQGAGRRYNLPKSIAMLRVEATTKIAFALVSVFSSIAEGLYQMAGQELNMNQSTTNLLSSLLQQITAAEKQEMRQGMSFVRSQVSTF